MIKVKLLATRVSNQVFQATRQAAELDGVSISEWLRRINDNALRDYGLWPPRPPAANGQPPPAEEKEREPC